VIRSFRCKETKTIYDGERAKKFLSIETVALRKLLQLNRAKTLRDLRSPGNALEALTGDRAGQYSIRVNDQYRLCFEWTDGDAWNVEIVDYH
jgi:toxin HigB-1